MALIVADTDVIIDFLRGSELADRVEMELRTGRLATTVISVFELQVGIRNGREERAVRDVLVALTVLPLDADRAGRAAGIVQELRRLGKTIGMADALIAGICLAHEGILLTRNTKDFADVPGLHLSGRYN
ncbi:MAG: type II toxin-antitoxin system VapC family toxin [Spirochaetales bacterium]|nr:type II toxin-antitoxin system VapC family toxin [Spirochaetales bacterium]